ncbi:hypothetical protein HY090_00970 [Candidatus Kaiserbacteria bacterium]|nr:hypothetical protein [Candidatus Kaiserbacteria bacterium]
MKAEYIKYDAAQRKYLVSVDFLPGVAPSEAANDDVAVEPEDVEEAA